MKHLDTIGDIEVPATFLWWQGKATEMIKPLVGLMRLGRSWMEIEGPASDHGLNADRLESFARPFLLWAHWRASLEACSNEECDRLNTQAEDWFAQALLLGTDPNSQEFWGYAANFHQHSVEIGLLVIGLEISRKGFWERFSAEEREQILDWLESDAGNGHHWNNHLFFGVMLLEFLSKEGRARAAYRPVIERWFHDLEGMYGSDGWYVDGSNQTHDFYNPYAWHYYGSWWIRLYGQGNPERCELWKQRTRLFLETYPRFFAASGEHPAFGRSITYRINATAPFGMAHLVGCSPLAPGAARSLCQRNLEFFLNKPILQSQGCLGVGWHDRFEAMAETYTCAASPYWAAKAFSPLLIPLDDPFWWFEEDRCPASKGDSSLGLAGPSLVVRNVGGEVELVNAGAHVACGNKRFGPHKWGRLSYKTGFGFTIPTAENAYPLDGGLTAQMDGRSEVYGRHYTAPVTVSDSQIACFYSLGGSVDQSQIAVETYVWWKADWQLIVHSIRSKSDALLRQGAYALSALSGSDLALANEDLFVRASTGELGVALQNVVGFESVSFDARLSDEAGPRRHIQAPYHATPILSRRVRARESLVLAALHWSGKDRAEGLPWTAKALDAGRWSLVHECLGEWEIESSVLPKV